MYNDGLMELLKGDRRKYDVLRQAFPQINERTRLERVNGYQVHISNSEFAPIMEPPHEWVNAVGWRPRLWRSVGELLNSPTLTRRGKKLEYAPPFLVRNETTLELVRVGFTDEVTTWSLAVAYHPPTDTLYIGEEW
jgi:hypothetical protein